jgi:hypothetical protein
LKIVLVTMLVLETEPSEHDDENGDGFDLLGFDTYDLGASNSRRGHGS